MSECALNAAPKNGTCLSEAHIQELSGFTDEFMNIKNKCDHDNCILDAIKAPDEVKDKIKREALKISTKKISDDYWLNNTEIDCVMSQYRLKYKGFGHGFIHMCDLESFEPANVSSFDYTVYPAREIDFGKEFAHALTRRGIINKPVPGFTSMISTYNNEPLQSYGIICNTDSSKGSGQHWFCIYISTDQKDPEDTSKIWIRIELFNSAGGGCDNQEFNKFWKKKAMEIADATGLKCTFDEITNIQHQSDNTGNCGSYSLFYIYSRLNHCLPSEFNDPQYKITDYAMLKFRSVCFSVRNGPELFDL